MSHNFILDQENTGLFLVDIQERLFPKVQNNVAVFLQLQKLISCAQILGLPIFVSEQYPKGLGPTIEPIRQQLPADQHYFAKTQFSAMGEPDILTAVAESGIKQWIVAGVEAHVCVLQTARDLAAEGYDVAVVNDAISSQSIYDFSTSILEMKEFVRISSVATLVFEMVKDANHPGFKEIVNYFKLEDDSSCCQGSCG